LLEEMGAVGAKVAVPTGSAAKAEPAFASKEELRAVFDRLLSEIDEDPRRGPRQRSTRVPYRLVFTDLGVVLEVAGSEQGSHALKWEFAGAPSSDAVLTLEMDSSVANRYLQGKENVAIAIARRRIRVSCSEARNALSFLPAHRDLTETYRSIIASEYPHLAID
jgi:hypothetical protein